MVPHDHWSALLRANALSGRTAKGSGMSCATALVDTGQYRRHRIQYKSHNDRAVNDAPLPPSPWPYPRWIAHRGAGTLAPENTLAAFRLGARYGYRMGECDVKLSADGVPFLLHDPTLERTTNGHGVAGHRPWAELSALDAGSWHSPAFQSEPLPTLAALAHWCLENRHCVNLEIKPTPGTESQTGRAVAQEAARLWAGQSPPPLLTSFQVSALAAARAAAPELPVGLLLGSLWSGWLDTAMKLTCRAVVCQHELWTETSVRQAKNAGLRTLAYTVNDAASVQRLLGLGVDGIITDRVDLFAPSERPS